MRTLAMLALLLLATGCASTTPKPSEEASPTSSPSGFDALTDPDQVRYANACRMAVADKYVPEQRPVRYTDERVADMGLYSLVDGASQGAPYTDAVAVMDFTCAVWHDNLHTTVSRFDARP